MGREGSREGGWATAYSARGVLVYSAGSPDVPYQDSVLSLLLTPKKQKNELLPS